MLLDRLMVALHHALEDEDPKQIKKINELYRSGQLTLPASFNANLSPPPKYFKGKSERDAYYGYKLINGQTGECWTVEGIQNLIYCYQLVCWIEKNQNVCAFQNSNKQKTIYHLHSSSSFVHFDVFTVATSACFNLRRLLAFFFCSIKCQLLLFSKRNC